MGTLRFAVLLFAAFAAGTASPKSDSKGYRDAANHLLDSLDDKAKPCDDFYQYACGGFQSKHEIPAHATEITPWSLLADKVEQEMKELLELPSEAGDAKVRPMMRHFYRSCLDSDPKKIQDGNIIESFVKKASTEFGPENGVHRNEPAYLTRLLAAIAYRSYPLFRIETLGNGKLAFGLELNGMLSSDFGDTKNTEEFKTEDGKIVTNPRIKQDFVSMLKQIFKQEWMTESDEDFIKHMKDVFVLEVRLSGIANEAARSFDQSKPFQTVSLKELSRQLPQIEWVSYFGLTAPADVRSFFIENTEVLIADFKLLDQLSALLKDTTPRVLRQYATAVYAQSFYKQLELYQGQNNEVADIHTKKLALKPTICMKLTAQMFGKGAYGSLYATNKFSEETRNVTNFYADHLQKAFNEILHEKEWMDEKTRQNALQKSKEMKRIIGHPDWMLDNAKLDLRYQGLNIESTDDFVTSLDKLYRSEWNFVIRAAATESIRPMIISEFNPTLINAFYTSWDNSMRFPAAFLQPPNFSPELPPVFNFGSMGAVIGHEITHGFDSNGRYFNGKGEQVNWWENQTSISFENGSKCFVEQYSQIPIPELNGKIDGVRTLGENIADNGGIREAYKAYKNYARENVEENIPGLSQYSTDQLFFIAYAQTWCRKFVPSPIDILGSHAPNHIRVKTVLSNTAEFATAFNCPIGSPMNRPEKRCSIW